MWLTFQEKQKHSGQILKAASCSILQICGPQSIHTLGVVSSLLVVGVEDESQKIPLTFLPLHLQLQEVRWIISWGNHCRSSIHFCAVSLWWAHQILSCVCHLKRPWKQLFYSANPSRVVKKKHNLPKEIVFPLTFFWSVSRGQVEPDHCRFSHRWPNDQRCQLTTVSTSLHTGRVQFHCLSASVCQISRSLCVWVSVLSAGEVRLCQHCSTLIYPQISRFLNKRKSS